MYVDLDPHCPKLYKALFRALRISYLITHQIIKQLSSLNGYTCREVTVSVMFLSFLKASYSKRKLFGRKLLPSLVDPFSK